MLGLKCILGQDQEWHGKNSQRQFAFCCLSSGKKAGEVQWNIVGQHNMNNALMAIAAATHVGVQVKDACQALCSFCQCETSFEVKGEVNGVTVYDDFAHHPAEILATLTALRDKVGGGARISKQC